MSHQILLLTGVISVARSLNTACDCCKSLHTDIPDLLMLPSTDLPVQKGPCATSHTPVSRINL